jgi:hypothetical protein
VFVYRIRQHLHKQGAQVLARLPRGLRLRFGAQGQVALQPTSDFILHLDDGRQLEVPGRLVDARHLDELVETHSAPLVLKIAKLAPGSALTLEDPLCDLLLAIEKAKIAKEYRQANIVDPLDKLLPFGTVFQRRFVRKLDLVP